MLTTWCRSRSTALRQQQRRATVPLSDEHEEPFWRMRSFWTGATGGVGAALAAVVVFLLVSALPSAALREELATAHVRAPMSGHLTDVVSTDQHTVKPWFAGRADLSPVVADSSVQGFALLGGRAEDVDRQRAAVLPDGTSSTRSNGSCVSAPCATAGNSPVVRCRGARAGPAPALPDGQSRLDRNLDQ